MTAHLLKTKRVGAPRFERGLLASQTTTRLSHRPPVPSKVVNTDSLADCERLTAGLSALVWY